MKTTTYLIILLLITVNSFSVFSKTIYVAPNGKDSNSGTINSPFATFAKAVSVMSPGDTCFIKAGTYEQELNIGRSGAPGNYLTFKAVPGDKVYINATKKVNNWTKHKGSIYKANVAMGLDRLNAVYFKKEYMDLARWPNNTDNNRWTIDCKKVKGGSGSSFLVDGIPNINWKGGLVYYLGGHSGTSWTRKITGSSPGRINHTGVNVNNWPFRPHNPTLNRGKGGRGQLFLFNKLEVLDYAREWYYDSKTKTLYFQTPNGQIPARGTVEVAKSRYTAQIKGKYVRIEGINFFGGSIRIQGDHNIFQNNKVVHGNEGYDRLDNINASLGEGAIEVFGSNTLVKGCLINHCANNGILIPSNNNRQTNTRIEQNTVLNTNYLGIHSSPIRTKAKNMKVLKNVIRNSGRDGMYVGGRNSEVAYNDVSYAERINSDSGLFYMVGNDELKGTEIHHNWFHDAKAPSYTDGKAAGIYLDNNSKGVKVHHNVIWNVSWSGYQVNWGNWNLDFFHNTIWNSGRAMGSWVNGYVQKNNRIYNNYSNVGDWYKAPAFDIKNNVISGTSPFENVKGRNFMPRKNSAVVDKGRVIKGFSKKFKGASPDIGAYELNGTRWTAGINAIEDTGNSSNNNNNNDNDKGGQFIKNGTYYISSTTSTQRLRSRSDNAHNVEMMKPFGLDFQKWEFKHLGNNIYTIQNKGTKRFMEVPFAGCGNSENVATWTAARGDHQKWRIVKNGASFGLKPLHCQKMGLDRRSGTTNANVQIWNYSSNNVNQKWKITSATSGKNTEVLDSNTQFVMSPNPVKNNLTISNIQEGAVITIYDFLGKTLNQRIAGSEEESFDLSELSPGVYIASIAGKGKLQFIKE
ncbi:RICIN domain-containing protein [Aquimarina sp. ERC-38]|uniref:RICIN domain-containing protein n=1 Tax=Aquimarina sp. ERC-38 TaxID=2949996 RepID=UPI0022470B5A|nr:RICIN domain-containing protein [Aquimarina sp. ERC-38]UZO81216.1 RICIN domain-containing protein [Aquimarina sp. ERC-38]